MPRGPGGAACLASPQRPPVLGGGRACPPLPRSSGGSAEPGFSLCPPEEIDKVLVDPRRPGCERDHCPPAPCPVPPGRGRAGRGKAPSGSCGGVWGGPGTPSVGPGVGGCRELEPLVQAGLRRPAKAHPAQHLTGCLDPPVPLGVRLACRDRGAAGSLQQHGALCVSADSEVAHAGPWPSPQVPGAHSAL